MIFKPKTEKPNQDLEKQQSSQEQSGETRKKGFGSFFSSLSYSQQRTLRIVAVIAVVVCVAYIISVLSEPTKDKKQPEVTEKKKYSLLTEKVDRDIWISAEGENIEQMRKRLDSLEGQLFNITKMLEELKTKKPETVEPPKAPKITPKPTQIAPPIDLGLPQPPTAQQTQPQAVQQFCDPVTGTCETLTPDASLPPPVTVDRRKPVQEKTPEKTRSIRVFENEAKDKDRDKQDRSSRSKENYQSFWIPAGTIIKATLLTGMDAPTDVGASREPLPVMMIVTDIAMLPNKFGLDLRECIIIGSGWGNLADERAYIRTETLSCITSNGKAFEISLKGHVYSADDGKSGIRGRYVSKHGQQIAMALLAGALGSFSQSVASAQNNVINIYTDNEDKSKRGLSLGESLERAGAQTLFSGVSSAARSVADFYLKLADKMYPVIEIDAGRKVEIIVLKGQEVKIKI